MAPITPSEDSSVETLIGVWLCHERLSQIGVSLSWKTEYLDNCIIITRHITSKVAAIEAGLYSRHFGKAISLQGCIFQMGELAYDKTIMNNIFQDLIVEGIMIVVWGQHVLWCNSKLIQQELLIEIFLWSLWNLLLSNY